MRSFLFTIFLLSYLCANAQQPEVADSTIAKILLIKNDSLRMDSLYNYADNNIDGNPKESVLAGKILLKEAQAHNNRLEIAKAYYITGIGYTYILDYPLGLNYLLQALRMQKELNLYNAQINSMLGIAHLYDMTGDFENEKKYVSGAMAVCEDHKTVDKVRRMQASVLDFLATIYKKEGRYDASIKLYNQAIESARSDNNTWEEINSLCNMAIALKSNKNYEASLSAYNQAVALLDTANEPSTYSVILDNMAILFYNMGDMGRSERYSLKALTLALKGNNNDVLMDIYDNLKNTYLKEKKYPEALEYFSKWSAVKDAIYNRDKIHELQELQTKYDIADKDKQIADQDKEIVYNRKMTFFLALSSVLFLLLGLIVYRNFKTQIKYNSLLSKEKKRSEDLLLNILPVEVANELKDTGNATARHFDRVTVMFTDFVNFTRASERMDPKQLVGELHACFKAFDEIIDKYNIEKIKTIGDSYLAVSGLPVTDPLHAEHIVKAAIEINEFVKARKQQLGENAFEARIGIHSGNVIAGIVGVKKFSYDIWGDTVNTAARMEQNSEPGRINISQTTYDLIKAKFYCEYRGEIDAKNNGKLGMYFVEE
jgi:adenylate cyclase